MMNVQRKRWVLPSTTEETSLNHSAKNQQSNRTLCHPQKQRTEEETHLWNKDCFRVSAERIGGSCMIQLGEFSKAAGTLKGCRSPNFCSGTKKLSSQFGPEGPQRQPDPELLSRTTSTAAEWTSALLLAAHAFHWI